MLTVTARPTLRYFRNRLNDMRPISNALSRIGGAQRAAPPPIVVVNHESDCHPHEESNPVRNWQSGHQQQAGDDGDDGCDRTARSAKGAWTVWFAITKNQYSRGNKSEGKKRADIGKVGQRSDIQKA